MSAVAVAEVGSGLSISPNPVKKCPPGIDTVGLVWSGQGGSALLSRIESADVETVPYRRGLLVTSSGPSGARVMAWPQFGAVKVEGRLAALADRSADSHRLATRDELASAERLFRWELRELLGVEPEGRAGASRFDLTAELELSDKGGQAVLKALRGLALPGYVTRSATEAGGVVREVGIHTARAFRKVARGYDKGVESGSHPAGERFRFEAQNRAKTALRRTPAELAGSDLRHEFGRMLSPFLKAERLVVAGTGGAVEELARQVAAGELTEARAERLAGSLAFMGRYGRGFYADDRKGRRRLQALREVGVSLSDELPAEARLPVGELLREMVAGFEL